MKLSIIIVSYNVKFYLLQCLDSVRRAVEGINAEICVVDNHSKDGTVEALKQAGLNVKIIAEKHNTGFAHANNIGIRQTTGEYVLLLNPDTFVGESTISECLGFMDSHPDAGGLGVRMLKCDGGNAKESRRGKPTPLTSFYKMSGLCAKYPKNKHFGKYYMCDMPWDEPGKIEIVSGAFFMARRSALERVGLLDEDFFMYGEDIDLSFRLLQGGYDNWYIPAKILHYKGESTKKSSFRYVHVFYQAMLIFLRKHYRHSGFWLYLPIKTAIYLKALLALAKIITADTSKMLGFYIKKNNTRSNYAFFGSAESLDRCRAIAERNGIMAEYYECNEISDKNGHAGRIADINRAEVNYMVYDTNSYKYETILDIFSNHHNDNVLIGTYNPELNIIITNKEILS